MMPAVFLSLLLGAYWALLSGQLQNTLLLEVGLVCILFVLWTARRMGLLDDEGVPVRFYPRMVVYLPYLAWQVVLANWDVFKRIWSSRLPIDPRMVRISHSTRHPFVTTTYANSITLTPGTVMVSVDDKSMLIHCLTKDAEDSLREGDMERHVKRLED